MKPVRVTGAYVQSSESGYVAYIEEFPHIYAHYRPLPAYAELTLDFRLVTAYIE